MEVNLDFWDELNHLILMILLSVIFLLAFYAGRPDGSFHRIGIAMIGPASPILIRVIDVTSKIIRPFVSRAGDSQSPRP
jgi:hypothetical protein